MNEESSLQAQAIVDEEHLRILRVAYFVAGGTMVLFACVGIFYALMGAAVGPMLAHAPPQAGRPPPPRFFVWFFVALGLAITTVAGALGGARLWVAKCLRQRTSRELCLMVAAVTCLELPYGTAIGVATFSVLGRPSVKAMFKG